MSTLEKARAFAKRSALSTAMTILPLAMAALNANAAAVTLTPDTYSPSVTVSGLFEEVSNFSFLPTSVGDVDGQKLVGSGLFFTFLNGTSTQAVSSVTITGQGTGSGTFTSDAVGVKWDFTLSEIGLIPCEDPCLIDLNGAPIDWTLDFNIGHSGGTASFSTSGSGSGQFTGSNQISGLSGISPQTWSIVLGVNYSGKTGVSIDIPSNSLAIPGPLTNAIPEPATMALVSGGLLLLAVRRARRS